MTSRTGGNVAVAMQEADRKRLADLESEASGFEATTE